MNKLIKKELEKLNIPEDQLQEVIYIPKVDDIKLDEGSFYFICLPVKPNNVVTANWNKGIEPTDYYYKVNLIKIMNNMINVNGISCDIDKNVTGRVFSGWLDLNEVIVMGKL